MHLNKRTNQELYFAYETYVSDAASEEALVRMLVGNTQAEIQTVHGCIGAAIQAGGRTKTVWIQSTSANRISLELISPDHSIEEVPKIAESDQKQ